MHGATQLCCGLMPQSFLSRTCATSPESGGQGYAKENDWIGSPNRWRSCDGVSTHRHTCACSSVCSAGHLPVIKCGQ